MPQEQSTPGADTSDLDYRLLIPFLAHTTIVQTLILIIRITTSYRAIELGLPVVWLGIIATGFAILPVFMALPVGRWIDRGNDAKACWIGTTLVLVACVGFASGRARRCTCWHSRSCSASGTCSAWPATRCWRCARRARTAARACSAIT